MKWLKQHEVLVILMAVVVMVRLPSLFEPYWYGDEQIYLAIGQGVRRGLVLYRDITDYPNKPPLIYLLAAVAGSVFWFRAMLLAWNAVHVGVMYGLLKRLGPERKGLIWGGVMAFILLTGLPIWEGNIANGEIFMIMPVTAGMLLLWETTKSIKVSKYQSVKYFLAGMLFAIGFLFKIPVAADIVAAGLVFWGFRSIDRSVGAWLGGLVMPVVAVLGLWQVMGVSPVELAKNAVGSSGYVSAWGSSSLEVRLMVVTVITGVIYGLRRRLAAEVVWGSVWLVWAVGGATLSGRPYPHYFLQVVPPLIVTAGAILSNLAIKMNVIIGGVVIVLAGLAYARFGVKAYPVWSYYKNFGEWKMGQKSFEAYAAAFDKRMPRNYQVAEYVRQRTKPQDKIYVWGTEPEIYVLSQRLPAGKLVVSFHVEDLQAYEATIDWLKLEAPAYIVVMENEPRQFEALEAEVEENYVKVKEINEAKIYRRLKDL